MNEGGSFNYGRNPGWKIPSNPFENLPEDSILNDVFNFDEWEREWEVAKRRQTVTMGALPENQLTVSV